jgi:DMSO/TMAO reductase YedYZ molybdopterin-dependent catalytic subunit
VATSRRELLGFAAAAAFLPSALVAAAGASVPKPRRRMLQVNGYAVDAETPLDALTTYLTPNDLFFVRSHWNPVMPDPASWALTVDGDEVSSPLRFSLADLSRLPRAEATCVLMCAGNGRSFHRPVVPGVQWTHGAVGNARWAGVRVKDVLAKAGLKGGAKHLQTFGTDTPPGKVPPFARSVEIEKVLEDGILAWEMNGEPLPPLHGAPVRLVVPGWAGDHWMKWLSRISASPSPQKGFYMDTAYRYPLAPGEPGVAFKPEEMRPVTSLFVKSTITEAPGRARAGTPFTISGFAFSGAPDVAKVEISADDGRTWQAATLDPRHDRYAWRLFSHRHTARAAGSITLTARATDSAGAVQPRDAVWNQSGYLYNAWHSVTVEVTA